MKKCRLCFNELSHNNVMTQYKNMPPKAQNFPKKEDLNQDTGIDLTIFQCPFCGLIQILEEPVSYYKQVIRAVGVSEEMKTFRTKYFSDFVNKYSLHKKNIIEIGAGCGEYMELMCLSDVHVYGLEDNVESVNIAKNKNLHMFKGFIDNENIKIPNAPYDAFYIMNFLEHIPNPSDFLKGIYCNLSADGVGLIEVPNVDFILENNLFSEFMLDHLLYFTKDTLVRTLEINGFIVDRCEVIWNQYILVATVHKRPLNLYTKLQLGQKILKKNVQNFISEMHKEGRKVAVWGAGHQSLAVLALTDIQDKIVCVIDSAEFKQNRYTPATHLPVCAPKEIAIRDISAVLIIAGSYSKEVANIIHNKYHIVKRCAILQNNAIQMQEV